MRPEWLDEVNMRLSTASQIVLAGALNEMHLIPSKRDPARGVWRPTQEAVRVLLADAGYSMVLAWSHEGGLEALRPPEAPPALIDKLLPGSSAGRAQQFDSPHGDPVLLLAAMRTVAGFSSETSGVPQGRAALLVTGVERLAENEGVTPLREVFAAAQQLARESTPEAGRDERRGPLFNCIVWLVEKEGDIPDWLRNSAGVQVVTIPLPNAELRDFVALSLLPRFPDARHLCPAAGALTVREKEERNARVQHLTNVCHGLTQLEMRRAVDLALDRGIASTAFEDAVLGLRTGLWTSPWRGADMLQRAQQAELSLTAGSQHPGSNGQVVDGAKNAPIRGQGEAVDQALNILSRAVVGLTDWDGAVANSKPRAVLFLAGPTGVGKTMLARRFAKALFGREDAMIRFDMSEYASEHNEARLIGSPPGYVGYREGGQLTSAVRKTPCCLLLFDEIDKAHERILDKFLQILEDGRLTDGEGRTVHFGETLIMFTSNLGIYERRGRREEQGEIDRKPLVNPGDPYQNVHDVVQAEIKRFFTEGLQRPEILNRIGKNIVVFNFLSPEAAVEVMHDQLARLLSAAATRREFHLEVSAELVRALELRVQVPGVLAEGGRGVKNLLEDALVNPLSRQLLHQQAGSRWLVTGTLGSPKLAPR